MEYIKRFKNSNEYNAYIATNFKKPNVSYCDDDRSIFYHPYVELRNVITYASATKLVETTSDKSSGFHPNKFNVTMVQHSFENGVGTIEFDGDVTSMGTYAFYNCSTMTSVRLPNSITSIGASAFSACTSLESVNIPSSLDSIGTNVFTLCDNLPSVNNVRYADTCMVTVVDKTASSVDVKDGTKFILDYAFQGCNSLTSVTIPNSVTSIGDWAFYNCSGLTSINISDNITSIGSDAFYGCSGMTSVNIGSGVTSFGAHAFSGCGGSLTISSNIPTVTSQDKSSFKSSLFSEVNIMLGVTHVGDYAFQWCKLTSLTISDSVTSVGNNAFQGCINLERVTIGSGVTSIGTYAFDSCTNLTSVTIEAVTPPTLGNSVFYMTNDCPIYVPSGSVDTYKVASGWSSYASRIQAMPSA